MKRPNDEDEAVESPRRPPKRTVRHTHIRCSPPQAKERAPVADLELSFKNPNYEKKGAAASRAKNLPLPRIYEKDPQDPTLPTHKNIKAPPSVKPLKKFCDITGFEAPYTDPRTGLRFADSQAFQFIRAELISHEKIQAYLQVRGAQTTIM